jgi:hypothetical protein
MESKKANLFVEMIENNFKLGSPLSFLPKDLWNAILGLLDEGNYHCLLRVSKSFYFFIHSNVPSIWKTRTFVNKDIGFVLKELSFSRFRGIEELSIEECPAKPILYLFFLFFADVDFCVFQQAKDSSRTFKRSSTANLCKELR